MKWSWTINLRRFFQASVMLRCSCPFWSNPRPGAALGDPEDNVFIVSLARRPEKRARVFRQLEEHQLSLTDKSRGQGCWCGAPGVKEIQQIGSPCFTVVLMITFVSVGLGSSWVFKRHTSLMLMLIV
jgi:hypothetical protein